MSLEGAEVCPHCGATALIEPSASLRWRCAVCGGGRIPGLAPSELGARAIASLQGARRGRAIDVGAQAGAIVGVVSALTMAVVAIAALAYGAPAGGIVLAGLAAIVAIGAAWLRRVAKRSGAAWREARDEAWAEAAGKIAHARGDVITAPSLAGVMRITERDAEEVLARLAVSGARVSVDDDAQLRYRVDGTPATSEAESESDSEKEQAR